MPATNPFRTSDLVAKYGWKLMVYLSNLGINNLAEAQVLFVDSGHANASDADDTEHGHSFEKPLATIDYAIGLCTASEQSIVLVAPGHAETKAATGALNTADVNGVKIIGLGEGLLRPTLTLSTDTGAVGFLVSAANVVLANIRILVSIDALVSAISVTGTDCKLIDMEVQDNANTTEAAVAILTAATADRLHVERFRHNGFVDGDACTESLSLIGVDRAVIKDCWFRGVFSTATINMLTTACTGIIIENCKFENGTEALVSNIVDTQGSSVWSAINCWDVVGGYEFEGGSGSALAPDNVSDIGKAVASGGGQHSPFSRINHAFGTVYYVDKATGSDSYDGLSPEKPKLTVAGAITVSNLTVGSYLQNAIYVNANTYTEDLTVFPTNCDVIGIGSKCRIAGNHTDSAWNCHWHNIEFRSGGSSAPIMILVGACHGDEFHQCRFKNNSANTTMALEIQDGSDGIIEDCYFGGNPQLPIGIKFSSATNIGWRILNNTIGATVTGIELAATLASSYQNLIKDNVISRQDPNSQDQMATGIKELKTDGHSGFNIVNNRIEAVDGILFTYTGGTNYHLWSCTGNLVNENGTVVDETAIS